ncbi:glycosyltransferase [Limnoraphis robusta Tam1]|uniref:Glycosyltransferase n=1 Tax=Limnoraphis robusta CCNP1315 TaxID=3110306 RepID=A0ABU5TUL6_9CYAN|nr:glycosyltransferase [Limnoraphis robusta]MCG5057905.1 glycosyltransferase [Limnoraphis sp. WC205]MEA5499843.1 glycosyltransferase [Limnoraphis robusta BA-68 BA1]MEA5518579.1 glycosyltransferase [Limnoraphis robusta CCNP1315]MEA5538691.1 glycosyltransferase [Limnoraphis robusta Tam1]MEA5548026.1 glycosyltransferase [Limnoraphis robusta CCNP1324]
MNQFDEFFVSVIIPVYNDTQRLKQCLQALEKQTYPQNQYEVIVVDNASEENVKDVVSQFVQARLTFENCPGSYAARNKGISVARGEILAFTDADCIPKEDWIETGLKHLLSLEKPGIIAGNIEIFFKNSQNPTAVELYDSITNLQQKKIAEEAHFAATANLFTFKKVFDQVGLFNQQLKSGGDSEWGKRAYSLGYPIEYAEDCCVAHPARDSLAQLYKKVARVRGGFYQLEKLNSNQTQQSFYKDFLKLLYKCKPPLIYAYKKSYLDRRVKSQSQKIKVFLLIILVHYRGVYERLKLLLGESQIR